MQKTRSLQASHASQVQPKRSAVARRNKAGNALDASAAANTPAAPAAAAAAAAHTPTQRRKILTAQAGKAFKRAARRGSAAAAAAARQASAVKSYMLLCGDEGCLQDTSAEGAAAAAAPASGTDAATLSVAAGPPPATAAGAGTSAAAVDEQREGRGVKLPLQRQQQQRMADEAAAASRESLLLKRKSTNSGSVAGSSTGCSCSGTALATLLSVKMMAAADRQARLKLQLTAEAAAGQAASSERSAAKTDASAAGLAQGAEHQRRREEAAAARLAALKNASLPEYLALLRQAKNGRLQEVLGQTDACLRQLAEKLGVAGGATVRPQPVTTLWLLLAAGGGAGVLDSSAAWAKLAAQLPADIQQQPSMVKGGQLREYQMQGLRWLVGLTQRGLNGILADDMGLGKTLQVISMVCHSVEVQQCCSPFLIVCPASVLSNWANELQHWAPDLAVVQYRGSADTREDIYKKQVRKKHLHVLLTTYELLMSEADRARLVKIKWAGIVVDEGHRLKNADCKLAQQLRGYSSKSRLLLTGTPLQNKLSELWALLNFLMPDAFSSADDFDSWFGAPLQAIKAAGSAAANAAGSAAEASMLNQEEYLLVTNRLHAVLRPFMLRRLKETVATELPQKSEVVLRCRLGPYQSALYDLVKSKLREEEGGGAGGVKGINNTVMELRNICNHPLLSKLHPDFGEDLLQHQLAGSGGVRLPAVLRLSCKVDLLDQVGAGPCVGTAW
ncbi:SNF2 family N-terminal domain-containing protein [Scenedesmus sp. NREL 46B-D3]|nr:SNF2 family N-terminal domain-containing protein [Scenedesmus sp. NREL 46B-D3]